MLYVFRFCKLADAALLIFPLGYVYLLVWLLLVVTFISHYSVAMNTLQLNMVVTLVKCLIPFHRVQLFTRVTTMFYYLITISHISCLRKTYLGFRVSSKKSNIKKECSRS